ncbi:MAG: ADP-ribosylglycohydrolase family protein, partial [Armatimonadetes bacterium]|nr:ADP-ribosylglycohydrolase family protein [Armatimonadota bacterium]
IMPPESGMPKNNPHYQDIDLQIEADLFGLINPGLPRSSNAQAEEFGRIMNAADGLYGGMFIAAMYSEAFFENDRDKVVRFGLRAIPAWSIYARTIRDVRRWHHENPTDWRKTWQLVQDKWAAHPSGYCSTDPKGFNIDASLNGAYVVMGLLYGNGDLAKTMEIAARCGQDSDCNPANAAGILGTILGYGGIPDEFKSGIPAISGKQFAYVTYSFNDLAPVCSMVARENVKRAGGSVKTVDGKQVLFIPVQYPQAPKLER